MSTTPTLPSNVPTEPAEPQPVQEWWNAPASEEPQAPEPAPAPQPAQSWFLRSEDGSIVYKTPEDTLKGIAEKNRVIAERTAQLERAQQLLAAQGVHLGQQPTAPQPQTLIQKMEHALSTKNDALFDSVMEEFVSQRTQSQLQPLMPMVERAAMQQAVEEAGAQFDPNIPAFVRSPMYKQTLDKWSSLKTAIQLATRHPYAKNDEGVTFGELLPQLLAQAFNLARPAGAPVAGTVQRTAPTSTTPPQVTVPGAPQRPVAGPLPGGIRDPFQEAWNTISDLPLPSGSSTGLFGE